jgi:nitrile hydratase subunit beta
VTARFHAGDGVRTRAVNPEGHTRLPRYLCDRKGRIEAVHGMCALPDDRAQGVGLDICRKEVLYTVVFQGSEVWRERSSEPLTVSADLWDSYLEPEKAR